jgi:NADP-dependent 3-hydroxy acid dehydrogenase YdfG
MDARVSPAGGSAQPLAARPVVVIVGAGPGVSGALAQRYARSGADIALLGTEPERIAELEVRVRAAGGEVRSVKADVTDVDAASRAIRELGRWRSRIDVLHFNPSAFREVDVLELEVDALLEDVALGVGGLLTAARAAYPFMSDGGRITVTGSMAADSPWHRAATLGVQKAGVRTLVRALDARLEPEGIRVASVTVRGVLAEDGPFTPEKVADALWGAAHGDPNSWATEVIYNG